MKENCDICIKRKRKLECLTKRKLVKNKRIKYRNFRKLKFKRENNMF